MPHLKDMKNTYSEHLLGTIYYSVQSFSAGVVFLFHGIFPEYCIDTGSNIIKQLHIQLQHTKSTESVST